MASQKRRCWAREGRDWTGTGTEQDPSILAGAGAPSSWLRAFLLLDMTIIGPLSSGPLWQLPLQLKVSPLLLRGKRGRMATTGCNKPPLLLSEASFAVPAPVWRLNIPAFAKCLQLLYPTPQSRRVLEPHRHQCPPRVPMSLIQKFCL